jgi:hypothetical protein
MFDALADSGAPNNLAAHSEIAKKALIAGGASPAEASKLVAESEKNLASQGAGCPSKIPWN